VVFRLTSGEREALITNLEEDEVEEKAFPELYYKRWTVETKYNQVKQKMEQENFSGRLVDNVKQNFHAMMTTPNEAVELIVFSGHGYFLRQVPAILPRVYRPQARCARTSPSPIPLRSRPL
jgi:hypothetical protein